jgi:predicted peroxiredoxin
LTERLALLMWAATPARPELCVTPLVHALAARALDAEVEIHFAGPAVRLLVAGVADTLYATPTQEKSIGDFLREAAVAGARFYACSMAGAAWIAGDEQLIPEFTGAAGATAFVARSLDPAWQTLVF